MTIHRQIQGVPWPYNNAMASLLMQWQSMMALGLYRMSIKITELFHAVHTVGELVERHGIMNCPLVGMAQNASPLGLESRTAIQALQGHILLATHIVCVLRLGPVGITNLNSACNYTIIQLYNY